MALRHLCCGQEAPMGQLMVEGLLLQAEVLSREVCRDRRSGMGSERDREPPSFLTGNIPANQLSDRLHGFDH